jgi:hypothetical protein
MVRNTGREAWFVGIPVMWRVLARTCIAVCCLAAAPALVEAQVGTLGAGALFTKSAVNPVGEAYLATPPVYGIRAYGIGSWTDDSWAPTLITAVERVVLPTPYSFTTLGAGLVWPEFKDYRPFPILTSTTVVPLTVPAPLSVVIVGSTQPFQDFEWTIVTKVAVTVFFVR